MRSKLWRVAVYEYRHQVFRKRFLLALLSVPALILFSIGVGWLSDALTGDDRAVGYVDQAGLLTAPISPPRRGGSPSDPSPPGHVPLIPFSTEEAARTALESGELQAYYVVTENYFETNRVKLVYIEPPDGDVGAQFWDFMQINRLTDLSPEIARRAVAGSNLVARWSEGGREFTQQGFLNQFLPLIVGVSVVFLLLMSSGYLMGAVVEEKENRTIEILTTSLSASQLMGGKIVGVIAVTLTQLAVWIAFGGLVAFVGGHYLDIELFQHLSLDARILGVVLVLAVPAYVMLATLMTTVGVTVADEQEAQQMTALFILPSMLPLWFLQVLIENPDSPLAIGLSLFPITSLPSFCVRLTFGRVPLGQIALGVAILSLCALGAVWLAGRAFRLGMLRYGQRLDWRELFKARA